MSKVKSGRWSVTTKRKSRAQRMFPRGGARSRDATWGGLARCTAVAVGCRRTKGGNVSSANARGFSMRRCIPMPREYAATTPSLSTGRRMAPSCTGGKSVDASRARRTSSSRAIPCEFVSIALPSGVGSSGAATFTLRSARLVTYSHPWVSKDVSRARRRPR